MEESKNKNVIIALLIVIIVILAALCVLFATGTITFNKSKTDNNITVENASNNTKKEDNTVNEINTEKEDQTSYYEPIIDEYKKYIAASGDNREDYTYVNVVDTYSYDELDAQRKLDWYYALYDINKDGTDELFVAYKQNNEYTVLNIFTYENNAIKKSEEYWGRSRFNAVYDNGIIVGNGSSSATEDVYSFNTLNGNKTYFVIIFDGNSQTIKTDSYVDTSYTSIEDMIKDNTKYANKVDIKTFNWKSIN